MFFFLQMILLIVIMVSYVKKDVEWMDFSRENIGVLQSLNIRMIGIIAHLMVNFQKNIFQFRNYLNSTQISDYEYTDNGFICKRECGTDGLFNGNFWCFIVSNYQDDWDYCSPHGKKTRFVDINFQRCVFLRLNLISISCNYQHFVFQSKFINNTAD